MGKLYFFPDSILETFFSDKWLSSNMSWHMVPFTTFLPNGKKYSAAQYVLKTKF